MDYSYLLPIGTIVQLSGMPTYVMIYGVRQRGAGKDGSITVKDYIAVPYPEGRLSDRAQFVFDHKDIEKIVFTGYDGPERALIFKLLEKAESDQKTEK